MKRATHCRTCGTELPMHGKPVMGICRSCKKVYARWDHKRRAYGLTESEFEQMVSDQEGKCLLCGRERKLVVDHDHDSGEVRGLLCYACNVGIGNLGDNIEGLQRAVSYLESYQ